MQKLYDAAEECYKFPLSFYEIAIDRSKGDIRREVVIAHLARLIRIREQKIRLERKAINPEKLKGRLDGLNAHREKLLREGGPSIRYRRLAESQSGIAHLLSELGVDSGVLGQFVELHKL